MAKTLFSQYRGPGLLPGQGIRFRTPQLKRYHITELRLGADKKKKKKSCFCLHTHLQVSEAIFPQISPILGVTNHVHLCFSDKLVIHKRKSLTIEQSVARRTGD